VRRLLRVAGLAAGVGLVLLGTPALTPAAGPTALPLTVDASLVRSGEVGVEGAGLLVGAEVRPEPGGTASGRQGLVSQTSIPVDVTLQDVGPPTVWEEHLWLRIALDDVVIFHGPRSSLRQTTSSPVRVAPGMRADVDVEVSLPAGVPDVHQGRRTELRLQIASTPVPPAGR
jgi:hypothetical protein